MGRIEEIPLDSWTMLVINFDPRFENVKLKHFVGEIENEDIASCMADELGGKVDIHELEGLVYVNVPWKPEEYYTLLGEVEDIWRVRNRCREKLR